MQSSLNQSNHAHVSEAQRIALVAEWEEKKRQIKRDRRAQRRSAGEQMMALKKQTERVASGRLRVTIAPLGGNRLQLRCELETHAGAFVELR